MSKKHVSQMQSVADAGLTGRYSPMLFEFTFFEDLKKRRIVSAERRAITKRMAGCIRDSGSLSQPSNSSVIFTTSFRTYTISFSEKGIRTCKACIVEVVGDDDVATIRGPTAANRYH